MASSVNRSPSRSRSRSRACRSETGSEATDDWNVRSFAPQRPVGTYSLDFVRPQPAPRQLGEHAGTELWLRSCLRNGSLRHYWQLRSRMVRSGGCHDGRLLQWVYADYPSDSSRTVNGFVVAPEAFDVVEDEMAEEYLWEQWGQGIWAGILVSEIDQLRIAGFSSRFDTVHFRSERAWGIPPSPYGFLPGPIFTN